MPILISGPDNPEEKLADYTHSLIQLVLHSHSHYIHVQTTHKRSTSHSCSFMRCVLGRLARGWGLQKSAAQEHHVGKKEIKKHVAKRMQRVGFEPTSTNTLRPERSSLDRSDNAALHNVGFHQSEKRVGLQRRQGL